MPLLVSRKRHVSQSRISNVSSVTSGKCRSGKQTDSYLLSVIPALKSVMCLPKLKSWKRCTPKGADLSTSNVCNVKALMQCLRLCVHPELEHQLLLQKAASAGWKRAGLVSWLFAENSRQCRHLCCKTKGCCSVYGGVSQREPKASRELQDSCQKPGLAGEWAGRGLAVQCAAFGLGHLLCFGN